MFGRGQTVKIKMFLMAFRLHPGLIFYSSRINKQYVYRLIKLYTFFYLFGLFRIPYIKSKILGKNIAQKQIQQQQLSSLLTEIDIKLSEYSQTYFIIISSNYNAQSRDNINIDDEQLLQKQRILFEINEMIKKKLEINEHYFQDIKFLFIGDQDIYKIIQVNNTIIDFHQKQKQKKRESLIYIMHRDSDGEQKLITAINIDVNLKSILNVVSKHKARKFAQSMQF